MLAHKRLRFEKDIVTRITRVLPSRGELHIKLGQEVTPSDIIGSAEVSSGFRVLNVASLLGVKPTEVEKFLKRQIGQRIYWGELLAFKESGIFGGKKIITSPSDSIIDYLNPQTGEIRMSLLPKKIELPAGVYGVVEQVDSEHGRAVIKTQVSRVFGVYGTGRIRDGMLKIFCKRDDIVTPNMVSPVFADQILVGGGMIYKEALSNAISAGVLGIVVGGMNASDYQSMSGGRIVFPKKLDTDVGISLVGTEGFGSVAIGEDLYDILTKYDGRFVSIDGNWSVINLPSFESECMVKIRSTQLMPLEQERLIDMRLGSRVLIDIEVGMMVRVAGTSYLGEQGKIVAIDQSESMLPSNIKTIMVTIETKRRKIKVPHTNIEII